MTLRTQRHAALGQNLPLLKELLRGIEKEGLRVDHEGRLAMTPHPAGLGSALTNPTITTDYSEALLELITATHTSTEGLMNELEKIHRFVASELQQEVLWNQSMPAWLPAEPEIPIAWYGTSNSGMLKHVYRRGLAERYGKSMQCIAGVHYNFSLPSAFWELPGFNGEHAKDRQSGGYMALIRNFTRYSWLLMYLFGASPAVSKDFLRGMPHSLESLDNDTFYLPWATSLRMSDLGYQNKAQSDLQLCYNDLSTFLGRMVKAVTTPWPAYEAIGTHRDGEWIQLNTNILQIENEYYSTIRPKRATCRGERPSAALAQRGVQYVEVRCLDIDPYSPFGISAHTSRFMDAFLLFCATEDSPLFPSNGFCSESHNNFRLTVKEGRREGVRLMRNGASIPLTDWAQELLEQLEPYVTLLDQSQDIQAHAAALQTQREKVANSGLTPSARLLHDLHESGQSFHTFTLNQSRRHHATLIEQGLEPELLEHFRAQARKSVQEQADLEQGDTVSFESYVEAYHLLPVTSGLTQGTC